jgi:2-iminoacetate synthase
VVHLHVCRFKNGSGKRGANPRREIKVDTDIRADFIDEPAIERLLAGPCGSDRNRLREILAKARELRGLTLEDVADLMAVEDPALLAELFTTARQVKEEIYGSRLVLFAPLYISNRCGNDCSYCAFRAPNREVKRRTLNQEEIANEVRILIEQGHKRVLIVAGEAYPNQHGFRYILDTINTVYQVKSGNGEIRRVNVNIAPLDVAQFRELKAAGIGTYQLFQETYHRQTYAAVHLSGLKRNYDWRVTAMDRAMEAGIDDVGVGPLFGLYDWRFEVLALLQHIHHLEKNFGCGCHTISMPRIEPAVGSALASAPPYAVSDADFLKLIAILRLAVPYTGMIMSTRENPRMRRESFAIGISQISAGSRTDPGGYADGEGDFHSAQFQLGDHRPMDEVIREIAALGYIPSFCTACYRLGRTGQDFMDLAKPGEIKCHCAPNAVSTFEEYLIDFASPQTRQVGHRLIEEVETEFEPKQLRLVEDMLAKVRAGQRDVLV